MQLFRYLLFAVIVILSSGCTVPELEPAPQPPPRPLFVEEVQGEATWYGPLFNGMNTDSGDAFDMEKLTASHRNFPMGSMIEVTNPENGKSVTVKINDRHNLHGEIQLSISRKAAKVLGVYPKKTFKVSFMLIE